MLSSFFVTGGPAAAGWTSYTPLSAVPAYTGVDWGQNLWCLSLIVLGVSSLMGSVNYITTVVNMRAPGMTWFRLPLTIWSLFITAILLLLALPVLTAALGMLLFDRMAGTRFALRRWRPPGAISSDCQPPGHVLITRHGHRLDVLSVFARKPSSLSRWRSR
jgi:cytochrome c oxidase subunit 1